MDDWKLHDHTNYDALAAYYDAIACGETDCNTTSRLAGRSYSDRLLDAMCFDEWKDAIDAEISALDDAEMAAEHLEETLDYEGDMLDREWHARGQW